PDAVLGYGLVHGADDGVHEELRAQVAAAGYDRGPDRQLTEPARLLRRLGTRHKLESTHRSRDRVPFRRDRPQHGGRAGFLQRSEHDADHAAATSRALRYIAAASCGLPFLSKRMPITYHARPRFGSICVARSSISSASSTRPSWFSASPR